MFHGHLTILFNVAVCVCGWQVLVIDDNKKQNTNQHQGGEKRRKTTLSTPSNTVKQEERQCSNNPTVNRQHRPQTIHSNNHIQTTHFKQPISNNPLQKPITKTHCKNPFKQPIAKTHCKNPLQKPIQTGRTAVFKQPNRQPVDTLTFYEFFRLWHFVHRCPKGCHSIFGLLRRFFFFACRRPFDR